MKPKIKDLLVLVGINIFAVIISLVFKTDFLISTFLFLGLPSLFLLSKEIKYLEKIFIASISFGVFFGFTFDFISELNNAWSWNGGLIFGKILGVVQIDVLIWFFLWIFHVFLFYEHFIDRKKLKSRFSKEQMKYLSLSILSSVIVVVIYKLDPAILHFNKAYLVICLVTTLPFVIKAFQKPRLFLHALPMIFYFVFVYLSHEITALRLGQWRFPGDYTGWIHLLGVSFPVEEFIFWIVLSSLIVSIYYELSFDNHNN